ncbi:MAG TPA: DinB family protein [Acidimicrobiales bacterium]|nr:DinB family protein [Acidimicrobiales bacterium]
MPGLTPATIDERDTLVAFLRQQRYVLKLAAYGLTDEEAQATPSASALSVGGIIKHVALTEQHWMRRIVRGEEYGNVEDEYANGFRFVGDETLASVLAFYDTVAADTEAFIATAELDQLVPVPKGVPWFPQDENFWSLRWVLVHIVEETARHAGHADIVRESIDGATGFRLLADYETALGNRPAWADYLPA